jgi:hypothetical protein
MRQDVQLSIPGWTHLEISKPTTDFVTVGRINRNRECQVRATSLNQTGDEQATAVVITVGNATSFE